MKDLHEIVYFLMFFIKCNSSEVSLVQKAHVTSVLWAVYKRFQLKNPWIKRRCCIMLVFVLCLHELIVQKFPIDCNFLFLCLYFWFHNIQTLWAILDATLKWTSFTDQNLHSNKTKCFVLLSTTVQVISHKQASVHSHLILQDKFHMQTFESSCSFHDWYLQATANIFISVFSRNKLELQTTEDWSLRLCLTWSKI